MELFIKSSIILCISALSVVICPFSFLILLILFFSFFLDESGQRFANFAYLLKEPAFSFINPYYCFFYLFFIYFCSDLYDFIPSTNFEVFLFFFFQLFRYKVRLSIRCFLKKQRYYFVNKGPSSQGYSFSSSHVWM